ncbi:MAG TPA: hypothetical protein VFC78_05120 [Tepidisphaeraceae bacterium]|nr:hypothetical protein [Tepidisphaeraceae bacterium]
MLDEEADRLDLLTQTRDRARRVWEALQRDEADLSIASGLEPSVREEGLRRLRLARDAAERVYLDAQRALLGRGGASSLQTPEENVNE